MSKTGRALLIPPIVLLLLAVSPAHGLRPVTLQGDASRQLLSNSSTNTQQPIPARAQPQQQKQQQPPCANGTRRCGSSTCLSLTDPAVCGPACTRCPAPAANGIATCSQQGVCSVSCAKGYEPAAAAGQQAAECRLCGANTFKAMAGPEPCRRCPAGTVTAGDLPTDHDERRDCLPLSCGPGTQPDLASSRCAVCPANTIKAGTNTDRCKPCRQGSRTFGKTASDRDEPSDCYAGGLIASTRNTGSPVQDLLDFEDQLEWALKNTGPKKRPPKPPKSRNGSNMRACLHACDGVPDVDESASAKVAHIAGSPAVYFMNDPSHVHSGVNLLSTVRDQQGCSTCVSHALASAAESAAAAAMRVDAQGFNISHTFSYFCANYFPDVKSGAAHSCGTGWKFEEAITAMKAAPAAFVMNTSCLGIGPAVAQLPEAKLEAFCTSDVPAACTAPSFTCKHKTLSDGLSQIQQHIRMYGSVVTRILVTDSFISFFEANPTGVFGSAGVNSTDDQSDETIVHAVQLIGYDNNKRFWLAKQSWGSGWGDKGLFKIAYGAAEVGHPEDTFALINCFTTSNDSSTITAWSDRWLVTADELPGCVLYNATARDTISGIADHFQVEILPFVNDNTERRVIPTLMLGEPPRPEPQLQPNTSWAGTVFRVCNITTSIYNRVARDPCTTDAKHCNDRKTRCAAGRCVCPERYAGSFCEIDNGIQHNFSLPNGQAYVLHLEPPLTWTAAQERCERDDMRLARLYSREHAIEVYKQVKQVTDNDEFWIGLNDRWQEGSFAWVRNNNSDTALDFDMWDTAGSQDKSGMADCVHVRTYQVLHADRAFDAWKALACDKVYMFLCGPAEESTDPCVRFPCSSAGTRPAVGCVAAAGNSSNSVNGRECRCDSGLSYVSDELGCVESVPSTVAEFQLNGVAHAFFLSPQVSWTEADRLCRDRGMNLVKITGEDYAQQLHALVMQKFPVQNGLEKRYWIGLNDRAAEGQFVWSSDGTSLAQSGYQRWARNEPSNESMFGSEEDCVWVWGHGDGDGFWNDGTCTTQTYFVCS